MRTSGDQYKGGQLANGFDYDLQVWVKNGRIQDCGHTDRLTHHCFQGYNCTAHQYHGERIAKVRADLGL